MSDKRVVITGASGMIGSALVERFERANYKVLTPTRSEFDLTVSGNGRKLIASFGKIDLLINNAADQRVIDPQSAPALAVTDIFQINALAVLETMVEAKAQGAGVCINLSSIEADGPRAGHEIYGASKAALEALTRSMANALAPMRINGVRLGLVGNDELATKWPAGVASWRESVAAARYATPEEVANFIFAISGDEFAYSTGAIFDFDGGKSASPGW